MVERVDPVSAQRAARIAGVASLALGGVGMFANGAVLLRLVVPGDAAATAGNIAASTGLLRAGVVAFLVVAVLDVLIAWALRIVFLQVSAELSRLAAWFRLAYAAVLTMAVANLAVVLQITTQGAGAGQEQTLVLLLVDLFRFGWVVGLALFGVHLVVIGRLVLATAEMPRALGIMLLAAGLAYTADSLAHVLLTDYEAYAGLLAGVVAVPSVVGELWLAGWLLLRGNRREEIPTDARERTAVS